MISPTLDPFRDVIARYGPPVVMFNKSHSGSRMLANLLDEAGISLGAHRNHSWDSLDVLELVEYLVEHYYPSYAPLFEPSRPPDRKLAALIQRVFERHLEGLAPGQPWGWKLCETVYVLPILDYCFPDARYVHLIRDGRDVAFCDHRGPDSPFWRKVYFNTDRIRTYQGLRLTAPAYRRRSYLYNAIHWVNSVRTGRSYGAMLRERYLEVRYEELCSDFQNTATTLLAFLEADERATAADRFEPNVYGSSVGKYRRYPASWLRRVVSIEKPLLLELGYLDEDLEPASGWPWHSSTVDRLLDRWHRHRPIVRRTDGRRKT